MRKLLTLLAGMGLLVSPPARPDPPPLVPRRVFFSAPERTLPQLSPDGSRIAWLAPDSRGVVNVWARSFEHDDAKPITNEPHRPIVWYAWAQDGAHVLYLQDNDGDGNFHLYAAELSGANVRDLTPWRGVRAQNVLTSVTRPGEVLLGLNLEDRTRFDMYRIDLATGAASLEARNPGDILTFAVDREFAIRAATAFDPKTCASIVRIRESREFPWRDLVVMPFERALFDGEVVGGSLIAGFAPDGKSLYIHSALHSDHGRLVRVDARTGRELEVVAEDPRSDVADDGDNDAPTVVSNPATGRIEAVMFNYLAPAWKFVDPALEGDFARINRQAAGFIRLISRDRADRHWIVSLAGTSSNRDYYEYDRTTEIATKLFTDYPELARRPLSVKRPVVIKSRDGLDLVSYLTTPAGAEPRNLPLVLLIHGGPWFRDQIDSDFLEPDFLANRGYAVLQVNYRGSTGLGLSFFNAGNSQWGRGTQDDLYDAAAWAIREGIADPRRIAAMGWSGGGYATLLALEQRPNFFACGVDGIGPADIATLFRNAPPYWANILARWRRRAGDVEHDDALNRRISPLYHAADIRAPLLLGAGQNDPIVTIDNVEQMVKALRAAKREVVLVVYPDEGHGFYRPENNLDFYGRIEEFLAKHLGGRAEPWTKIEGATAEVR